VAPAPLPWPSALVSGASSGIGEAMARELAARGSEVLVLVARRRERLEALAAELTARHGTRCEVLVADLADPGELRAVETRVADPDRPLDLLVNNAGTGTSGRFVDLPADGEEHVVRLNVVAPLRLTAAALPAMVARGRGAVVQVSSLAAYAPAPGNATYAGTKAFLTTWSEGLHEELRGTGVTVTTVCPGFTRTEFADRVGDSDFNAAPGFVWMSAATVAREGLEAAARGRALSVPGAGYKAAAAAISPLPRSARRWLTGRTAGRLTTLARRSGR
jgi:short-subunit dehydrogenase